jgi:hypothetical protein
MSKSEEIRGGLDGRANGNKFFGGTTTLFPPRTKLMY